jgi:hypothetical protein
MKKALITYFLFFLSLFAQAQITQTIRGTVIDKHSQTSIIGANVVLLDSDPIVGVVTDIDGKFRLEKVPVGRQGIQISFIGYNTITINNLELSSGKEMILNIELEEKVIMGEEVVIVAKKDKDKPLNQMAVVSARTFSIEESQRYAGSLNDVSRMAMNFAGVQSGDDSRNDLIIRGNSPIGVLYRLDGVDIPNPNHFSSFGTTGGPISILNNNVLANSDFMTSAFPAEYGNALSAVFDLKMRNGNNEQHEFTGQIGFNGAELLAEGPLTKAKKSSYLISYRYSTLELFKLMGLDFGTQAVPKYQDMSFKFSFPHKKGKTTLFGLGGLSTVEFKDSETEADDLFVEGGQDVGFNTKTGAIGLSHVRFLKDNAFIRAIISSNASSNYINVDTLNLQGENPFHTYGQNSVQGKNSINILFNKKFNAKHLLRIGGVFDQLFFNLADSVWLENFNSYFVRTDYKGATFLLQPYAQWQYRINNDVTLNTGLHYQHFLFNNSNSIEPRIGLKWQVNATQAFGLGYGLHSLLPPTRIYFRNVDLPDGTSSRPNNDLGFMKAHHAVLSYDRKLSEFLRIKAEVYYQHLFDVPVNVSSTDYSLLNEGAGFGVGFPDSLTNKGAGTNYGIELTLEQFLNKGFYFLFTASLFDSKYTASNSVEYNSAFNTNYTFNLLAGKEFELGKNKENKKKKTFLSINVRTTWTGGGRHTPILLNESIAAGEAIYDETRIWGAKYKDYFRSDLRIGLKLNGKKVTQEWGFELQNITNRDNIFTEDYNATAEKISTTYQIGFLPIFLYKILF